MDATAGTGTGSGVITVADAINASTSSPANNYLVALTLKGSQIRLNANVNVGARYLYLNANRGSVWQDPSTVITTGAVYGTAQDGFTLNGNNQIGWLGNITNIGSGGISIKNSTALVILNNTIVLDGGKGGVTFITPGIIVDSDSGMTVKGSFLRLDLGGNSLTGGSTINAKNMDVYFTGKTTGNDATIDVGNGSFTFVNDKRSTTGPTTLTSSTTSATLGTGLGNLVSGVASGGLTVTTSVAATGGVNKNINYQGVVYGGTVNIQGITAASPVGNLRYIEATGIGVNGTESKFAGSLTLVSSGSGITPLGINIGIRIDQNLTTGTANDGTSNLNVIQSGAVTGAGIYVYQSTVTSGGTMNMISSGSAVPIGEGLSGVNDGINVFNASLRSGGAMRLTQSGTVGSDGLEFYAARFTSGGAMTVTQSGSTVGRGIVETSSIFTAAGDLLLNQNGTLGNINAEGIYLASLALGSGTKFTAGVNNSVTLKTNNSNLILNYADDFAVTRGMVRIDLGTAKMIATDPNGVTVNYTLKAIDLDVNYTGATVGNDAQIDIGTNGSFTLVGVGSSPKLPLPVDMNSFGILRNGTLVPAGTLSNIAYELTSNPGVLFDRNGTRIVIKINTPNVSIPPIDNNINNPNVSIPPIDNNINNPNESNTPTDNAVNKPVESILCSILPIVCNIKITPTKTSTNANNQVITVLTPDEPIVKDTIANVLSNLGNLNNSPAVSIQIPTINNISQVINVESIAGDVSGNAKTAQTSDKKSDGASESSESSKSSDSASSDDSATNGNAETPSKDSPSPNLSLMYSYYAPLVRLSDDLVDNYLFPMAANSDLWSTPKGQ